MTTVYCDMVQCCWNQSLLCRKDEIHLSGGDDERNDCCYSGDRPEPADEKYKMKHPMK